MKRSQAYTTCIEIMKATVRANFTTHISKNELKKIIMVLRGCDPRTFQNWFQALISFGFIEPHRRNPNLLRLNLRKVPEALVEGVKVGQKKLL